MASGFQVEDSLDKIGTLAVLNHDPLTHLGLNFTVCSHVSKDSSVGQVFFTLLGKNMQRFLELYMTPTGIFFIYTSTGYIKPTCSLVPAPVPHQWTRMCLAIQTLTGHITLVVNGMVIEDSEVGEERTNSDNCPTNLTGRLLLGTYTSSERWRTLNGVDMVTDINVFSTALTKERMMGLTRGGGEECGEEGDYLAWGRMEWELKGEAEVTLIGEHLPCGGEDPDVTVQCPTGKIRSKLLH